MKNLKRILIILFTGIFLLSACDTQKLEDLNNNPNAVEEMNYGYVFSDALLTTATGRYEAKRANMFLCGSYIQQYASLTTSDFSVGDKYLYSPVFCSAYFDQVYRYSIKQLVMLIGEMKDDPEMVNNLSMARIWRVLNFQRLTDLYGDVPYTDAGKGYTDQNYAPKYDKQSFIYPDMLKELDEALNAFDPSKTTWGEQDFIYKSDISKWKKFGYSLMLRLGMRLSKVDPAAAETWVAKAITGGVMTSNDDGAFIPCSDLNRNGNSDALHDQDYGERISRTFVDFLQDHGDPRLDVICHIGDSSTVHQGLPNGYNYNTIKDYMHEANVNNNEFDYVNRIFYEYDAPYFVQTYAEVELLLAEAAERSWGGLTPADAPAHYDAGVRAAMHIYKYYDASLDIPDTDIDAYLLVNPYNPATGLQQIGEQYWVATWMNFYEGYANWRRTGYPVLTPVNYPGNQSNGQIPRRIRYAESEYASNASNLGAAITDQGPDAFTTHMWWDKAK